MTAEESKRDDLTRCDRVGTKEGEEGGAEGGQDGKDIAEGRGIIRGGAGEETQAIVKKGEGSR